MVSPIPVDGLFPRRPRTEELHEAPKEIKWRKIPTTIDDLADARTIRNDDLDITIQSEAFDVGFSEPDFRTNRRLDIF